MALSTQTIINEAELAGLDKHGYLFGEKLTHSLSPSLHQVIYDQLNLHWSQLRLDSSDLQLFLNLVRHPSCFGQ